MKKLIILILIFQSSILFSADELNAKRQTFINTYEENLNAIWKISEDVPPDYYLSSLGISLLTGPKTSDVHFNLKIEQATTTILFTAANTSLLMAMDYYKKLNDCEITVFTTKKLAQSKVCISEQKDEQKKMEEKSFCENLKDTCLKSFHNMETNLSLIQSRYKGISRKSNQISDFSLFVPMDSFTENTRNYRNCEPVWPADASINIFKACSEIGDPKRYNIDSSKPLTVDNKITEHNGMTKTTLEWQGCDMLRPNEKLPLLFPSGGQDLKGNYCRNPIFHGLHTPENEYLMMTPELRAFYWIQVAEAGYEMQKKTSMSIPKDSKNVNDSKFSVSGLSKCNSPIRDELCLNFADKFQATLSKNDYLFPLLNIYSDIKQVGNLYNAKNSLSEQDLQIIDRLARKIEDSRNLNLKLKNDLKILINNAKVNFSFEDQMVKFMQ